jgi:hypothetical protein
VAKVVPARCPPPLAAKREARVSLHLGAGRFGSSGSVSFISMEKMSACATWVHRGSDRSSLRHCSTASLKTSDAFVFRLLACGPWPRCRHGCPALNVVLAHRRPMAIDAPAQRRPVQGDGACGNATRLQGTEPAAPADGHWAEHVERIPCAGSHQRGRPPAPRAGVGLQSGQACCKPALRRVKTWPPAMATGAQRKPRFASIHGGSGGSAGPTQASAETLMHL